MDRWEKFNETSILDKENFYSKLNHEGITDEDHAHCLKNTGVKLFRTFRCK